MLGIIIVSCSDDAEEPTVNKTNSFTVDDTEYSLSEGLTLEYGGDATTGYNFDLYVYSSGIDVSGILDSGFAGAGGVAGTGEVLYFELWSTSATGLASGTYAISLSEAPNTYTVSELAINFGESSLNVYEATAGTVNISKDGSTYSIDFDLTVTGGKAFTGNYTGTLPNFLD